MKTSTEEKISYKNRQRFTKVNVSEEYLKRNKCTKNTLHCYIVVDVLYI